MFKVLLIVYVLGGGSTVNGDGSNTYTTNFIFQEFYSTTDCKVAKQHMQELVGKWHIGSEENTVSALYSAKCVTMTAKPTIEVSPGNPVPSAVKPTAPPVSSDMRRHKRWDD